jgi:GntR family uxuAB operon transcriptional repressor
MVFEDAPHADTLWGSLAATGGDKKLLIAALETAIRDGRLRLGERLPTERMIAQAAGLSRNTVRDALARLADRGMIARQVGRGTFVVETSVVETGEARDGDAPAGLAFAGRQPSPRELVEFRAECEPALTGLIVMNASDQELADIQRLALTGRSTETWSQCEEVDSEFHARLFAATGNGVFLQIGIAMRQMRKTAAWLSLKQQTFSLERWQQYQAEHETIIDYLIGRDSRNSRDALRHHFARVRGWVAD